MSSINISSSRVSISELLPEIKANVVGINSDLALQMLMNAAVKLARDTKLIEKVVCIPLEPCIGSYIVDSGEDIVYALKRVKITGANHQSCTPIQEDIANRVYLDAENGVIYVDPEPTKHEEGLLVELTLAMIPDRNSDTIPEYMYQAWSDAIVSLTLSNIFKMADAAWYSMPTAKVHYAAYQEEVYEIRRNTIMRNRSINMRLKPAKGLGATRHGR